MKTIIFAALLVSCVFVAYSPAQDWNIRLDFPDAPGFSTPYNGWAAGVTIVKSAIYPLGDYDYDTFSAGYFDAEETQPINILSHSQLDPAFHALINTGSAGLGAPTNVLKNDNDGCVAVKSYMDNIDLSLATEQYDGYLRWTAPATGEYFIQMGMMFNGYTVKTTISRNGVPLEGLESVESTASGPGNTGKRVNFFHPRYPLAAGDVMEMRFEPGGTQADWKFTRVFGVIQPAPAFALQESFEDPNLPGWTEAMSGGEPVGGTVVSSPVRTGTGAVEFPDATVYGRMTLTPFVANSDARNIELKIRFYDMPDEAWTHQISSSFGDVLESVGATIRVIDTTGRFTAMLMQYSNLGQVSHGYTGSPSGGWNGSPSPYGRVFADPGWNEFRITVNALGHVTQYLNDIPVSINTEMLGIKDIIIGKWANASEHESYRRVIYDDLEITSLDNDPFANFPEGEDKTIQNLHQVLYEKADLNRDLRVDMQDFAVLAQSWLDESDTLYPVSDSGGQFYTMDYGNFRTTIASDEVGGGFGRGGGALTTTRVARSGNEAMSIPKGRFGRVWRQLWPTNNNDCTATVWLYHPAGEYVGPLEVNLLDESYNGATNLRVYAGYAYDPMDTALDTNVVKTMQGVTSWTDHPEVTVNAGWNKVQFVLTPEDGTGVYFNDTLIRTFTPAEFAGASVMYVGKDNFYGTAYPDKGLVIFDDMSGFDNAFGGDPDAIYSAVDLSLSGQVDVADLAEVVEAWLEAATLLEIDWSL